MPSIPTRRRPRGARGSIALLSLGVALSGASLPAPALAAEPEASPAVSPGADSLPEFPTTIGGQELEVLAYSGPEWVARFDSGSPEDATFIEGTEGLVAAVGGSLEDLTVLTSLVEPTPGNRAAVMAVRMEGADAEGFADDVVDLMLGDVTEPELVLRPLADRWVLRVVDAAVPGVYPRTVYAQGDTTWLIDADESLVVEVLEQLPAQDARIETDAADALVTRFPLALQGQRRTGLYELLDWTLLPSVEFATDDVLDQALLDLYLSEGITPTDVTAAIGWWGEGSTEDAAQIEGYRIPGASAEILDRFVDAVLMSGLATEGAGVSTSEEQVGGRDVLVVAQASEKRYVFVGGDTAWVITDYTADESLIEEAIASLP